MEKQEQTAFSIRIGHILVLAVLLRILILWIYPDQNFPDAAAYITSGQDLFTTGIMGENIYMPLYPIWTFLWGDQLGVKIGDILLSVATIWVVYHLALLIFNQPRVALISALAVAIYPHFIFYSVSRLTETPFLFLLCLAFLLLYKQRFFTASVVIVLSILVKPTLDLLAPLLICVFVLLVHRLGWRVLWRNLAIYGLVYVVLMTPWWLHNYQKYGEFVRLSLGDGVVLYSGNNPQNTTGGGVGYSEGEIGYGRLKDDLDFSWFRDIKDPLERNKALKERAIEFISENPDRFVELAAVKFVRFWRLWPFAPQYQKPHLIAVSLVSYGVALGLVIWGLPALLSRFWRRLSPVFLLTAYLTAVHMVTIASIRYRLPLEPFLIILAAWQLENLSEKKAFLNMLLKKLGFPRQKTNPEA